jgi:iron complex transport system permease protein
VTVSPSVTVVPRAVAQTATRAVIRLRARLRVRLERPGTHPGVRWGLALATALLGAVLLAATLGAARIPAGEVFVAAVDPSHPAHRILWDVRLPRIAAGALVGAALGVSGVLMQAAVRNPLADPGVMGVTAGAGLAGLVGIILWPGRPLLLPVIAFGGGLAAVSITLLAAWSGRRPVGPLRLVLSGVAVQAVLFALIALVMFLFADRAPAFVSFTIGSLNGLGWHDTGVLLLPTALGLTLALLSARTLDVLLLDDDSAAGVGLSVRRARLGASCLSALLAAGAVSGAGLVGFVGLVVPNWIRALAGPRHALLLPLSTIGGAALVVLADTAARTVAMPVELPVGALLALVGGPYFLFVVWRRLG